MSKQVPEGSSSVFEVRELMRGSDLFQRVRGKFKWVALVQTLVDGTKTPTEFLSKLDETVSDLRVIGNFAAKLKRDGKPEALKAFYRSLCDPRYLFSGEKLAEAELKPVTLVMFEMDKTLALMNWIMTVGSGASQCLLDESNSSARAICEKFPSLLHAFKVCFGSHLISVVGPELNVAYYLDVLKKFRLVQMKLMQMKLEGLYFDHRQYDESFSLNMISQEYPFEMLHFAGQGRFFSFFVEGEQKDLLSQFPREMQDLISTWQFRVPKHLLEHVQDLGFGLHTEAEHILVGNQYPLQTSFGCQNGHGAVLLDVLQTRKYIVFNGRGRNRVAGTSHVENPRYLFSQWSHDNLFSS